MIRKAWQLAMLTIAPRSLLQHGRQHRLGAQPCRFEVELEAALPFLVGHRERLVKDIGAGIVDQYVDAAGPRPASLDQAATACLAGHVRLDEKRLGHRQ